ncbi:somatomedin-B and thrombospondin type-1 domain-containing protein-like isoform X1 [Trachemys scripta elegans]|uniref:somatomedin-B and thrombospondin type-1 domain-containing protein-like isoform X1 n=1 Tax=Trachemys scripta elegans TaxID=31138 RepID=UPI001554A90C|nr:somatomedin-B and thrombospondin type-1 domain-containing protein-like isoform X1 [Trachemys scripta elegans]
MRRLGGVGERAPGHAKRAASMGGAGASPGCWVLYWGWLLAAGHLRGAEAGCGRRGSPRCCPGRNNACADLSGSQAPCYCDTYCEKTGDCCEDYPGVCQRAAAIHCVVRPWGPWSECSSLCGVGSQDRTRQVAVPPRNGGTPCPDLKQRRGCFGENPACDTAKEVAKILPGSFKRDFKDPWRRPHVLAKEKQPSYCVYFRLKQVGAACRLPLWSSQLMRERRVCVECRPEAVASGARCEGDGLEGARTFWTATSIAGCQGSWIQESRHENCMCPPLSLIFV